jgi:tRNA pseudouridine55 synthase
MTHDNPLMVGVLNLDKAAGVSSARAVDAVKRLLPRGTKIGHAGTLDPFATGVLLLLVGKATKQCERLMDQPKQYEATVMFGATTATDDSESPPTPWISESAAGPAGAGEDASHGQGVTLEMVCAAVSSFVGTIQQRPPAYSAMKIGGRRAYDLARRGDAVKLKPRTVQVYGMTVVEYAWPLLRLRIDCGRGTYVRAIARDLGEALNVGGHLTQLRRTRIGEYRIEQSVKLEQLNGANVEQHLHPL